MSLGRGSTGAPDLENALIWSKTRSRTLLCAQHCCIYHEKCVKYHQYCAKRAKTLSVVCRGGSKRLCMCGVWGGAFGFVRGRTCFWPKTQRKRWQTLIAAFLTHPLDKHMVWMSLFSSYMLLAQPSTLLGQPSFAKPAIFFAQRIFMYERVHIVSYNGNEIFIGLGSVCLFDSLAHSVFWNTTGWHV